VTSQRIRILTANLWSGRADPDRLAGLVVEEQVDVACVQELAPAQADALAAVLPHGQLEPGTDSGGMGVAARAPVEFGVLPLRLRPLRTARLDPKHWSGLDAPLDVWNVHVCAPHNLPPLSFALRRAQVRRLLAHLEERGQPRLVLVGDLNATPHWPAYRALASRLRDLALEAAARRGEPAPGTWAPRPGRPDRRRWLRIDHALGRGVSVLDVRRLHLEGSDHDALCVDLALEGQGSAEASRDPSGGDGNFGSG